MAAVGKKSHKLHGKITQTPAKVTALAPEKPVPPAFSDHLAEGLGATIAINAAHYDKLPYISNPFPFSQPCRIGAIARLFGLTPVDPARARILEIGCASGGNIIPLAARYPMASVVGIDISAVQVEAGCARIVAQGLDNIKIHCASITDFEADAGSFDYIICHGVFSWVPEPVRAAILAKTGQLLSPNGVADVSYNVLPGWRMRQALRDAMVLHAGLENDPQNRVTRARWIIKFLKEHTNSTTLWGQVFQREADMVGRFADDYIAHEFLESTNEPMTFTAFAEQAATHGLAYLGDADIAQMIPENLPVETAASLREMCGGQVIAVEQYMDIVTGRTFRQSLLVRQAQVQHISRLLDPERLAGAHLIANRELKRQQRADGIALYADPAGRTISTNQGCVAQALNMRINNLPASIQMHEVLQHCANVQEQDFVKGALTKMLQNGLIMLSSEALNCVSTVSEAPKASKLNRVDAARGIHVVNALHESVHLGLVAQILMPHLDGSLRFEALVKLVLQAIADGRLSLQRDGVALTETADLEREAAGHVTATLRDMAHGGLLVA